jgi:TIR domain
MTTNPRPAPQVFVSYSRRDAEFTNKLISRLQEELGDEHAIWFDANIGLGKNWWEEIKRQLKRSRLFLVILSPNSLHSNRSRWVKREIDIAWQRYVGGKMEIIPIQYLPCKIPDDLNTLNVVSFVEGSDYEQSFQRLIGRLRASTQKSRVIREFDAVESNRFDCLVKQIREFFQREDWRTVIDTSNILRRRYSSDVIPSFVYELQGLAYLHTAGANQEQLIRAERTIKRALRCAIDSPSERLELLDIYAGILISQERWNEILPFVENAYQLLPLALPPIKLTANDPGVWHMLQEEVVRKTEIVCTPPVSEEITFEEKIIHHHLPDADSLSPQPVIVPTRASLTNERSEKTQLFQLKVSWSWQSFHISVQRASPSAGDTAPIHKVS